MPATKASTKKDPAQRAQRERRLSRLPQYTAGDFRTCGDCGEELRPNEAGEIRCGCEAERLARQRSLAPSREQITALTRSIRADRGELPPI
jgi:DNA-directed RNA polymerase subunit RPC12/RpoP